MLTLRFIFRPKINRHSRQQDGTYICNEKYNHKKIRVRIDQPVKSEQKAESDETHKTAEEDRKYVIQVYLLDRYPRARTLPHMRTLETSAWLI